MIRGPGRAVGVIYPPATERRSHYIEARLSKQSDAVADRGVTTAVWPLGQARD